MNIPNQLTILRILLVPIFIYFLLSDYIENNLLYALIVFILASVTDFFDGKIARKAGLITDFGKFLDPLADKILVLSAFVCFVELGLIGAIPVIIMLTREFLVTSIRLSASSSGKVVSANILGKIKTFTQMISICLILFFKHLSKFIDQVDYGFCEVTFNLLIIASVIFSTISGYTYIKENLRYIKLK
ncbi:MAG: CDP-diacylglycerol--glycerol-3-phosphate 3-phosphatidyltransferase [Clostridia bacterium]|nr:CDP-diacylglycerol--glycerol-3-phosphate 3-phosphatidyltransferase [Clostridia bacterium]